MKKLATFTVLGAVLAAGLPGQALATNVATIQCNVFSSTGQLVVAGEGSPTPVPVVCVAGASSCAKCIATLINSGYTLLESFAVDQATSSYAGPYYILKK